MQKELLRIIRKLNFKKIIIQERLERSLRKMLEMKKRREKKNQGF